MIPLQVKKQRKEEGWKNERKKGVKEEWEKVEIEGGKWEKGAKTE